MSRTDARVDAYIAKSAEFAQPILAHLRAVVHAACPQAEEAIKWSMPFFLYQGRILGHMAAFKQHCAFGFWHGEQAAAGQEQLDGMGQYGRITSLKDMPPKRELTAAIKKAMKLIDEGVKPEWQARRSAQPAPEAPPELAAALKRNAAARRTFESFSPSNKREYVEWITEAKREDTRAKRIAQAVEWMAEGKPRNWKYMRRA